MQQIWTDDELRAHWVLSDAELALLQGVSEHRRLTVCVHLKFFQFHARFPGKQDVVPQPILEFLASQVGSAIDTGSGIMDVPDRTARFYKHQIGTFLRIRRSDTAARGRFVDGLVQSALPQAPNEATLDAAITDWFLSHRMVRPRDRDPAHRVARSERQFEHRLFARLAHRLSAAQRACLDGGIATTEGGSQFAEIARDPGAASVGNVLGTVARLDSVRAVGLDRSLLADVHPDSVERYRRRLGTEDAWDIRRHPEETRDALLCCYLIPRAAELTDALGDLLISLTHKITARAESRVIKELVSEFRKVEGTTTLLFKMAVAADGAPDGRIRAVIFPVVGQKTIKDLANEYRAKNPTFSYRGHHKVRRSYSHHCRRILPAILKTLTVRSRTPTCRPLREALEILKENPGRTPRSFACGDVPLEGVVKPRQQDMVLETGPDGQRRIHRLNCEICVLQSLRERWRIKEVWIEGADRHCNPDLDLPQDFEARNAHCFQDLNQPLDADHFVERLKGELVTALEAFDRNLPANDSVTLKSRGPQTRIVLKPRKAQEDPAMLTALKGEPVQRGPMTRRLDVLKEAALRIGFTKSFSTAAARQSLPAAEVSRRLLLALHGMGTNIGRRAIAAGPHHVSCRELLYLRQRFIHKNALRAATRAVADATHRARRAEIRGVSSSSCASDSTPLASWDQNLMTEWHQRGRGRGVMIDWHVDAKATCIHSQLKQVASSEVAAMIEGVLHHGHVLEIDRQFVDTHGQSIVGFAFCHLLGFHLMPRFKDIAHQKLVRADPKAVRTCAHIEPLFAPRPINWALIAQQYDAMIKLASALKQRTAAPETILRRFIRGQSHPVFAALLELGKVARTLFLCRYRHDRDRQRAIHSGLNVIECWNGVNDFIVFGNGNERVSNRRDDQEISVLSLHLLQSSMVDVNTLMIQEFLADPVWRETMTDRDRAARTPLPHRPITPYGVFDLDMEARRTLNDMDQAA